MKLLINAGADVNSGDFEGTTPLHFATMNGRAPAVQLLVEAGADPSRVDNKGVSPLDYATFRNWTSVPSNDAARARVTELLLSYQMQQSSVQTSLSAPPMESEGQTEV